MNTHNLRSILCRQHAVPFIIFFLPAVIVVCGFTASTGQSSATVSGGRGHGAQKPPFMPSEDIAKEFNDDDLKVKGDQPGGNWRYSTLLDSKRNDRSVPAYVSGVQLLSGAAKHRGITKIKRVQIKNRSSQTIVSVQVRFEVVYFDEPEKILLEDTFPLVNVSIAPDAYQVVDLQTLYPARMLKALAKNGELYGHFGIRMGVQEVRFADGSFWRRPESLALLKSPYLEQSLDLRFPALVSLDTHITPPFRSTATKRADMTQCTLEPRLTASAFSYAPFQTTTCHDNAGPSVDLLGKQSCGVQATSTCHATCSDDGWCETWQSETPCSNPTPTPTPTPGCPQPQPAPCCEEEQVTFGTTQHCQWDCRAPRCPAGTPFADGCYSVDGPVVCPDPYVFTATEIYGPACCPATPTPTPTPPQTQQGCEAMGWYWSFASSTCSPSPPPPNCTDRAGEPRPIDAICEMPLDECDPSTSYWDRYWCECVCTTSPVLLDTRGDGFALTDGAGGVNFDLNGDGSAERLAWTAAGSDDAWLALDRDGDGRIGNGRELFGNFTPQPEPAPGVLRNGFLALAVYDQPAGGGNSDGVIDGRDAIFTSLLLWRDANHDGVSQPGELHPPAALHVASISLDYKEVRRRDRHGNQFRYQAAVASTDGRLTRRLAYDVFLAPGQ